MRPPGGVVSADSLGVDLPAFLNRGERNYPRRLAPPVTAERRKDGGASLEESHHASPRSRRCPGFLTEPMR